MMNRKKFHFDFFNCISFLINPDCVNEFCEPDHQKASHQAELGQNMKEINFFGFQTLKMSYEKHRILYHGLNLLLLTIKSEKDASIVWSSDS
jgi:hypothetical protein